MSATFCGGKQGFMAVKWQILLGLASGLVGYVLGEATLQWRLQRMVHNAQSMASLCDVSSVIVCAEIYAKGFWWL